MTREMRFPVSRAERVSRVWRQYGAAALAVVATMGLLGSVPSLAIAIGTPQLILFLSVLVAAWYGGFGPGIFATALIVIPTLPAEFTRWTVIRLVVFVTGCVLASFLM